MGIPDAEMSRTLRIEVSDEDVTACRARWDEGVDDVEADDEAVERALVRALLEVFAERLRARQWVEVPVSAVIPAGMLWRREPRPGQQPNAWFCAQEEIAIVDITPGHRAPVKNVYLVPGERLGDLIDPEPPKDLAARLADRLPEWTGDTAELADVLRAALAAEGVEG